MNAKEMFEKLGYKEVINNENFILYKHNMFNLIIRFFIKEATIKKYSYYKEITKMETYVDFRFDELQAINKQVEELGC